MQTNLLSHVMFLLPSEHLVDCSFSCRIKMELALHYVNTQLLRQKGQSVFWSTSRPCVPWYEARKEKIRTWSQAS